MKIGKHFKTERELKGLSRRDLATLIRPGFEESLLRDFEDFDDNDLDGWLLNDFKAYCTALDIAPGSFAEIAMSDLLQLPLPSLVKARREEKNFSIEALAEDIGYHVSVIEAIESGRGDSEVCIDALRSIGSSLDIPFRHLLEKI